MRKYSEKKIAEDKTGEGYIFQMFYNELSKAKKPIELEEETEVLKAMGYDLEDLQSNPALSKGLRMAVSAVNDEVYEDNRPQPVDYYHFTGRDGKKIKGFSLKWYMTQAIKDTLTDIKFKIDFNNAVTSYLLCEWGTLNREADKDNDKALKTPSSARIIARYHTSKGDMYIKTDGESKTVIMFAWELVKKLKNKLPTLKYTEKTGNYTVYMHVTPDEKLYIGMTQDTEKRYGNGLGYRRQPFYEAIKKYGWNNIDHEVIVSDISKEEAKKVEHDSIVALNAKGDGYNQNNGGSGSDEKPVRCITDGNIFGSERETAEHYKISETFVRLICKGIRKSAKGLKFEFV